MQPFFNPAAAGKDLQLNVTGAYSMQLTGFENAPKTMYVGVDLPLFFIGPKHGVGLSFMNDEIGLFRNQRFVLQYAYHHKLWGGRLSGGVQVMMLSEAFDGSKVDLDESGDHAIPTSNVNGSAFDLGAGLHYSRNDWYLGVSMMHCLSPTIELGDDKTNELSISPVYYLTGGYNIKTKKPFITLHPTFMVQSDFVAYRADLTCRVAYSSNKVKMYGGLSYSPTNSVSFLVGGDIHGVTVGYAYEMYTSAIGAGNGTHEIVLRYQTDLDLFKKGKNKHKSVRIL